MHTKSRYFEGRALSPDAGGCYNLIRSSYKQGTLLFKPRVRIRKLELLYYRASTRLGVTEGCSFYKYLVPSQSVSKSDSEGAAHYTGRYVSE